MRSFEPLPTERSALIARIKKVVFTPTRFRGGYDEREVDNFLDAVVAGLSGSSTRFTPARIRDEVFLSPDSKVDTSSSKSTSSATFSPTQ